MRSFLKSIWGQLCIAVLCIAAVSFSLFCVYQYEQYLKPKFQDVTVELGTESITMAQFLTEDADPAKASFASDISHVDIGKVGSYALTMKHGSKEETVTLTVEDTVAPTAQFITQTTRSTDYIPQPSDFVTEYFDLDAVTLSFQEDVVIPENYANLPLTVVVADASGNAITQECTVKFAWMKEAITLELGQSLSKDMLLYNLERDADLLSQEDIDKINASGVGAYELHCTVEDADICCIVTVQDTTAPELKLKNVSLEEGARIRLDDFVKSAEDLSGDVKLEFVAQPTSTILGKQTVKIRATDASGNSVVKSTQLTVQYDVTAPVLKGLKNMRVAQHSTPDYMKGVSATDNKDKSVSITYDASKVNTDKAGTYYVTYTARDDSGNVTTSKRKVTVKHDQADTDALVKSIAAKLSSDPEKLRNYVRSTIRYNHNWGGSDPVWYGFKNKAGNCYVHAVCLRELLREKGHTCQLIWTTQKTHYWLIIKITGTWKHIDPTPGRLHSKYSLMNDEQRLSTLSGRTWDFSKWPACP